MDQLDDLNQFIIDYFENNRIEDIEIALNFDEDKKKKAISLHNIIKENIERITKEFYEYNLNYARTKKYFRGKAEIDRLIETNKKYFQYLFSGPFDINYYHEKIKIGYKHYLRSIPNGVYLSSLGNLNSILNKLWREKFEDIIELYEAQSITSELLFIEVYFTINTYYTFLEKNLVNEKIKIKEILDNIHDGYFIINKNLTISEIVSKSCHFIFNENISGKKMEDVFSDLKINKSDIFILTIKQYFENIFNIESIFNMFPYMIEMNSKIIKLSYTPIFDINKKPEKIIICASDITDLIKNQKIDEETHSKNISLLHIIRNRTEFDLILKEISVKNITLLDCDDVKQGKIILHEYKNYFTKFGLTKISALINNLEFELIEKENNDKFNAKEFFSISCCMLSDLLKKFLEENYDILGIPS